MKIIVVLFCLVTVHAIAQNDTVPSGVYSWAKAKVEKNGNVERRNLINGSTLDLVNLEVHSSTLPPNGSNHPMRATEDAEELIIIKEGTVQVTVEDSTKTIGPGGLVLLMAGDRQTIKNISDKPATYFVLMYKSKDGLNRERGKTGGGTFMQDWSNYVTIKTDKGESRPIFDRPSGMFKRFDVHATALNPGKASHPPHTHRTEEIILMIKGSGEMQIGETFHKATTGDVIFVNSNAPHAFTNTGNTQCGYFAIQWHTNAEK